VTPTETVLLVAWGAFALAWALGALHTAPTVRRETAAERLSYVLPTVLLALLVWTRPDLPVLGTRFAPEAPATFTLGAALLYAGVAFAIWARVHLGRYWSGTVTLKEGHRLIRTGPYAIVRNPIYTGLIAGFLGSALLVDRLGVLLGAIVLAVSFLVKIRREERFLTDRFGEEFLAYKREVRSLIPGVW
jgi:protein-S-isoprenylcysteine O-methyltransferase Ste14